MSERPPGGAAENAKKLAWAASLPLGNRLFSEWSANRYAPEQSEFRQVLESLLGSVYDRELEPERPKWDARDRELIAATEWNDNRFCIEDADANGQWELTPDVRVDENTGKISVRITCKHVADQKDQNAKPQQEQTFLVELQAAPQTVAQEKTFMQEAVEQKQREEAAQKTFDAFASANLNRPMTGAEAETLLHGDQNALAWGMIPDQNTFEIKENADNWSITVFTTNGNLLDVIERPKWKVEK